MVLVVWWLLAVLMVVIVNSNPCAEATYKGKKFAKKISWPAISHKLHCMPSCSPQQYNGFNVKELACIDGKIYACWNEEGVSLRINVKVGGFQTPEIDHDTKSIAIFPMFTGCKEAETTPHLWNPKAYNDKFALYFEMKAMLNNPLFYWDLKREPHHPIYPMHGKHPDQKGLVVQNGIIKTFDLQYSHDDGSVFVWWAKTKDDKKWKKDVSMEEVEPMPEWCSFSKEYNFVWKRTFFDCVIDKKDQSKWIWTGKSKRPYTYVIEMKDATNYRVKDIMKRIHENLIATQEEPRDPSKKNRDEHDRNNRDKRDPPASGLALSSVTDTKNVHHRKSPQQPKEQRSYSKSNFLDQSVTAKKIKMEGTSPRTMSNPNTKSIAIKSAKYSYDNNMEQQYDVEREHMESTTYFTFLFFAISIIGIICLCGLIGGIVGYGFAKFTKQ